MRKNHGDTETQGRKGFTLLEVLIAATLFAIASSALFVTFRTGIRAWDAGHSMSEVFQTARVAQDVVVRDLNNIFYRTEEAYNQGFWTQMQMLIATRKTKMDPQFKTMTRDQRESFQRSTPGFGVKLEDIPPPIDLSFHGEDGDKLDTLEFARRQRSWESGMPKDWGLRRIRYYVKDGVLYREESSPFGLRRDSGDDASAGAADDDSAEVLKLFYRRPRTSEGTDSSDTDKGDRFAFPDIPTVTEPMCEGVEIFNVTYGYYRQQKWNEVEDWDSARFKYRFPQDEEDQSGAKIPSKPTPPNSFASPSQAADSAASPKRQPRMITVDGQQQAIIPRPDDLPGYVAIQIGVRDPRQNGDLRSFTIFISLPEAQEEPDTSMDEGQDVKNKGEKRRTEMGKGAALLRKEQR